MRITMAIAAIFVAAMIWLAPTAWADRGKDSTKANANKVEKGRDGKNAPDNEGNWRRSPTGSVAAGRQNSGPYRYFFTDHEGKYNYFEDRYGYPSRYGQGETRLPVGVHGYAPPEQIGGGPVRYFRQERPLSRSVFDGAQVPARR